MLATSAGSGGSVAAAGGFDSSRRSRLIAQDFATAFLQNGECYVFDRAIPAGSSIFSSSASLIFRSRFHSPRSLLFASKRTVASGKSSGNANSDASCSVLNGETRGGIEIRHLRRADFADRIPILAEKFRLAGIEERKIRLIVGKNAGHQLDVRSVVIGQIAIPRVAEFVIAPRPLFFAGRDVMIRKQDQAGALFVIVAAGKIFGRAHSHVAGRHGNVGVPTDVVRRIRSRRNEIVGPFVRREFRSAPRAP